MKKFAFIFAFSALFAAGLSAQTVARPKTAPMPTASTSTASRSTATNSSNTTVAPTASTSTTAPATKPKSRLTRSNRKAAKAAQPVAKHSQQLH